MLDLTKSLAVALALGLAGPALAQEATAPAEGSAEAPAEVQGDAATTKNLSMGAEVGGIGSTYTQEVFGDWELRCVRTEDGSDPCQLYQLLKDTDGTSVAEISMFALPEGGEAAAGATIITPLETLLTQGIRIQVDGGTAKAYPFTWCAPIGCIARVGFKAEEIEQFKKGAKATLTIVPVAAPDKKAELSISLSGFTAGFDAVSAVNAKAQAKE